MTNLEIAMEKLNAEQKETCEKVQKITAVARKKMDNEKLHKEIKKFRSYLRRLVWDAIITNEDMEEILSWYIA